MPVVFVHGVPDTQRVWDVVVSRLERKDVVTLSLPGFGCPLPSGFSATKEAYVEWLLGQLGALPGPVDLVGHDWGGAHVVNVAMTQPELLRTWASDSIGVFHRDYVWHELAQIWQTEPAGEEWVAAQLAATTAARGERFLARGMAPHIAARIAAGFDATMGETILRLYRAARQPVMAELGTRLPEAKARPGLVLVATADDAVGTEEQRREVAEAAGASVTVVDGGHWWLTEPASIAPAVAALQELWARSGR
jgi:pimeloyl-ACP methyl ester carboxylesterase